MKQLLGALVLISGFLLFACGSTSTDAPLPDAAADHVVVMDPDARTAEDGDAATSPDPDGAIDTLVTMDPDARVAPDRASDTAIEETPIDQSCNIEESSSLPGVRFVVRTTHCTFRLAEVAAGIAIPYDLIVDQDVTGFVTRVYSYTPDVANLLITERVTGNQQSYCVCDRGLPYPVCPDPDGGLVHPTFPIPSDGRPWYEMTCAPFTIPRGIHHRIFRWDGRNWFGPSDTSNPEGAAFPAGDYELEISTNTGTLEGNDASALGPKARVQIHLVP